MKQFESQASIDAKPEEEKADKAGDKSIDPDYDPADDYALKRLLQSAQAKGEDL